MEMIGRCSWGQAGGAKKEDPCAFKYIYKINFKK